MLAFDDITLARSLANKPLKKLAYLKRIVGSNPTPSARFS